MKRKIQAEAGFSLIELAIIVGIIGLMVASSMQTYLQYKHTKEVSDTSFHRDNVVAAMERFVYANQRLPCPADPTLTPNDPKAGQENCLTSDSSVNYCEGGVCRRKGYRDTSTPLDGVKENLIIGTVPYMTLGIGLKDAMDGWGNKMGYAVTQELTEAGKYDLSKGVINIQQYIPTLGALSPVFNNTYCPGNKVGCFSIALWSAGPDRKGAYNYYGTLQQPCTAGTGYDVDNCNSDNTFVLTDGLYSNVKGPTHYDDPFVIDQLSIESDKWAMASAGVMNNKTNGNVGIGTQSPAFPLDVGGNMLLENYYSDQYCNSDTSSHYCFDPGIIGGIGINCNGGVMTGVASSKMKCADLLDMTSISPATCGSGMYMKGIDASGNAICQGP